MGNFLNKRLFVTHLMFFRTIGIAVSSVCHLHVGMCMCVCICVFVCVRVYVITGKNKVSWDMQSILFLLLYEENYENEKFIGKNGSPHFIYTLTFEN